TMQSVFDILDLNQIIYLFYLEIINSDIDIFVYASINRISRFNARKEYKIILSGGILLFKRLSKLYHGKYCCSGRKYEISDQTMENMARHELFEETGLEVEYELEFVSLYKTQHYEVYVYKTLVCGVDKVKNREPDKHEE
ncbi:41842_t:CDS:2, partial [Gigaspora margarita]